MKRAIAATFLLNCAGWLAIGQTPDTPPKFEIADVHVSPKSTSQMVRIVPVRNGRYELKNASMVDLVRIAYDFDADKVLGGPSWLEMDRFDVLAKIPPDSTPETHKPMLQSLLADRFKLVVHKDTRPVPTYALTVGKKPQLKEASGSEETGCKPGAAPGAPAEGGVVLMFVSSAGGTPTQIKLGPGMTVQYACRNMTMAAFAAGLGGMLGASLGPNAVLDETGLKGGWNFDVSWSMGMNIPIGAQGDRISVSDAVEKQLGLKLEEKPVPTPVIVVDSVNEKPSDNPPGLAETLPVVPAPTEFEVASVRPTSADNRMRRMQMQPGGRLTAEGMTLRFLLNRAFNTNNSDQIAGVPKWADTDQYDITAKAPSEGPTSAAIDTEAMAPMLRALLADRFKMIYHMEDRPVTAYSLTSVKPKMKQADPASRTWCKTPNPPAGAPPGSRTLTCQNVTMAQFADRLQNTAQELNWPVLDATGIEGRWDLTLTYSMNLPVMTAAGGRGGDAAQPGADMPAASDPTGGLTVFQAVEKQLGLKLEMQKRPMPVIVIDHIEEKPTEN
jgi:uncharacterized protein (TIGR03435 family)